MKNIKLMISLLLIFNIYSCSNSHDNNDDYIEVWEDFFIPNISPYNDDTEIVEYSIPKKVGNVDFPQYADWDTIFFGYRAEYRWDNSNLDSIRLLSLDTNHPWNWNGFFILKKDGKERSFNDYRDLHDDTSKQEFDELTRQLIIELAPRMLGKVFYLDDNISESNPFIRDTIGDVKNIVQLVPPKK